MLYCSQIETLMQWWATIFFRGPHCVFISVKKANLKLKIALRGPDVARGPYVALSCFKVKKLFLCVYNIPTYYYKIKLKICSIYWNSFEVLL